MSDKRRRDVGREALTDEELRRLHAQGHRERVKALVDKDPDFQYMTPVDVLEYALFFGIPRKDTKLIAHRLLDRFGDLHGVASAPLIDLKSVKGMTDSAARILRLLLPMSRMCMQARTLGDEYIESPGDALDKFHALFMGRNEEILALACMDINGRLMRVDIVESGSPNSVAIDLAKIIRHALNAGAVKIILAHNHPAGSMVPSLDDVQTTMDLAITARGANIALYDHFIITDYGFVSMYNNGVITTAYQKYDQLNGTHFAESLERVHEYNSMYAEYRLRVFEQGEVVAEPLNPRSIDFYKQTKDLSVDTSYSDLLAKIKRDRLNLDEVLQKARK